MAKSDEKDLDQNQGSSEVTVKSDLPSGPGNVDKIRDILFGNQMKNYDKRFARLEDLLQKKLDDLKSDTKKRMDSLETYFKKEVNSLGDKLKAERQERSDMGKEINKEMKGMNKALEKKDTELENHLNKTEQDLRQQLLDQSKTLMDEIQAKYEKVSEALEQARQELSFEKVDRSRLSTLFTEIAMSLSNEMDLSGLADLDKDE